MKQSAAVFFLLLSVIAYSVFPLIGTHTVAIVHPVLFIGLSHLFALIAISAVTAFLVHRDLLKKTALGLLVSRRFLLLAAGSGIANAGSHASLFASFAYISSASATALYEIWPIAVVLLIGRLLPQKYSIIKVRQWLFIFLALSGVALLVKSATSSSEESSLIHGQNLYGVVLALLSGVLMAISSALDVSLTRRLDALRAPFIQPIIAQNVIKIFSSSATILFFLLLYRPPLESIRLDISILSMAAATGVFVIAFGAVAYHIGNILAESPTVNLLWYLTPVFALLWLDLSGAGSITPTVAVGAILIISANLLLTTRADSKSAYAGTLEGLCLSAFFCIYVSGADNGHYYDMIAASTAVFAILAGFMLQRVSEKAQRVSNIAVDLLEAVIRSTKFTISEKHLLIQSILDYLDARLANTKLMAEPLPKFYANADNSVDLLSRKISIGLKRVVSFGEMLVLVLLAVLSLLIAHLERPASFIGDFMPVVLTGVMVFLCVRIYEEERGGQLCEVVLHYRQSFLHETEFELTDNQASQPKLISVALLFVLFALYGIVLVRKHGLPIILQ